MCIWSGFDTMVMFCIVMSANCTCNINSKPDSLCNEKKWLWEYCASHSLKFTVRGFSVFSASVSQTHPRTIPLKHYIWHDSSPPLHWVFLQMRTTGCLTQRGRSEGQSPSGCWVFQCLESRQLFAGARTLLTTLISSSLAATGGLVPSRTAWSPSTHAACRTGVVSLKMLMLLSGTFMVRQTRN